MLTFGEENIRGEPNPRHAELMRDMWSHKNLDERSRITRNGRITAAVRAVVRYRDLLTDEQVDTLRAVIH